MVRSSKERPKNALEGRCHQSDALGHRTGRGRVGLAAGSRSSRWRRLSGLSPIRPRRLRCSRSAPCWRARNTLPRRKNTTPCPGAILSRWPLIKLLAPPVLVWGAGTVAHCAGPAPPVASPSTVMVLVAALPSSQQCGAAGGAVRRRYGAHRADHLVDNGGGFPDFLGAVALLN